MASPIGQLSNYIISYPIIPDVVDGKKITLHTAVMER